MTTSLSFPSCRRSFRALSIATFTITLVASMLVTPVQACMVRMKLNPKAEAHFLEFPDKSVRFASNKLELDEDDLLFIRLPDHSEIDTSNGNATLSHIRDISVLESARFTEIAPLTLISGANIALQSAKQGRPWTAFQAIRGTTTLTVTIDGVKSVLHVSVRPYSPPAPEPVKVSLETATQDKPFGMRAGQQFEISLPGRLADGWTVDIPKDSRVELESLTPAKPSNGTPGQPMVKLQFSGPGGGGPINTPQRISIRRGGVFNGETFDIYLVFYPIPTC